MILESAEYYHNIGKHARKYAHGKLKKLISLLLS